MITGQTTYPRMSRPEQAYVQIDQVGQFTAAAGLRHLRRRRVAGEVALQLLHRRADAQHRPSPVREARRRELHDGEGAGREQTEFMRSGDMWFRPIETRVGPDGALYIVDFYNQAVIHNDTRGPQHGPANAAVRPDRDHYFGRIWRVQHKQATKLHDADARTAPTSRA